MFLYLSVTFANRSISLTFTVVRVLYRFLTDPAVSELRPRKHLESSRFTAPFLSSADFLSGIEEDFEGEKEDDFFFFKDKFLIERICNRSPQT